ncbi:unnamed protein product [Mesocestoides corti]|uniref:Uncharacterized protein n=1 Tax=Mesocestoides corti TaxID=53468 RepID=A0A3P6GCJ3_MESCO|nr:unnamed protein product [Mesocestoides corti]
MTEHHSMQNAWETFLADIGGLLDNLKKSFRREEDVVKHEMSLLQSANGRLQTKINDDKVFIENLMADNETLRNSLNEQTTGLERSNNEISNLQAELTKIRSALSKVTEERDLALASLHQAEKNMSEQQETFYLHIKEIEKKLNQREFETKDSAQRHVPAMETAAARRIRENQRMMDAGKKGGVPPFDRFGLNDLKRRRAFHLDPLQEAKQQITHLKAELAERDSEVERLEALVQERTAFVETRAAELAELQRTSELPECLILYPQVAGK